jgi:hypothetical protein
MGILADSRACAGILGCETQAGGKCQTGVGRKSRSRRTGYAAIGCAAGAQGCSGTNRHWAIDVVLRCRGQ